MKEDNSSITGMEKRYFCFYSESRKSRRTSIFMRKNWEILTPFLKTKRPRRKIRRNIRFSIRKTDKWTSFWTHLINFGPMRSVSYQNSRRTSLRFLNKLERSLKYQINFPPDPLSLLAEPIKLKIPWLRLKLNMKSGWTVSELWKTLRRGQLTYLIIYSGNKQFKEQYFEDERRNDIKIR